MLLTRSAPCWFTNKFSHWISAGQWTCSVVGLGACVCDWFFVSDPVLKTITLKSLPTDSMCCLHIPFYFVNYHQICVFKWCNKPGVLLGISSHYSFVFINTAVSRARLASHLVWNWDLKRYSLVGVLMVTSNRPSLSRVRNLQYV